MLPLLFSFLGLPKIKIHSFVSINSVAYELPSAPVFLIRQAILLPLPILRFPVRRYLSLFSHLNIRSFQVG
jgi:hypothetical protein